MSPPTAGETGVDDAPTLISRGPLAPPPPEVAPVKVGAVAAWTESPTVQVVTSESYPSRSTGSVTLNPLAAAAPPAGIPLEASQRTWAGPNSWGGGTASTPPPPPPAPTPAASYDGPDLISSDGARYSVPTLGGRQGVPTPANPVTRSGWLGSDPEPAGPPLGSHLQPRAGSPLPPSFEREPLQPLQPVGASEHTQPVDLGTPWAVEPAPKGQHTPMLILCGCMVLGMTGLAALHRWTESLHHVPAPVIATPLIDVAKQGQDFYRSARQFASVNDWEQALRDADSAYDLLKGTANVPPGLVSEVGALRARSAENLATRQMDQADKALGHHDFAVALAAAKTASDTMDHNAAPASRKARALALTARIYERTHDLSMAENFYRQASQMDRAGRYDADIQRVERALTAAPETDDTPGPVVTVTPDINGGEPAIPTGRRGSGPSWRPNPVKTPVPETSPTPRRRQQIVPPYVPPAKRDEPLQKYKSNSFNG